MAVDIESLDIRADAVIVVYIDFRAGTAKVYCVASFALGHFEFRAGTTNWTLSTAGLPFLF